MSIVVNFFHCCLLQEIEGSTQTLTMQSLDVSATINQLVANVETMRANMQQIHSRINLIERSLSEMKNQQLRKKVNIWQDVAT